MTKLIYFIVRFLMKILGFVFGVIGLSLVFILALPLVGWSKLVPVGKKKGVPKMRNPPPPPPRKKQLDFVDGGSEFMV